MNLASMVAALERHTQWEQTAAVTVAGDVGHPQGLTRWGDRWLVSTMHSERCHGELLVVADDGTIDERIDVTDGPRYHPGGFANGTGACLVAVAEYRPNSTANVFMLDEDLRPHLGFRFDDHLGAICDVGDGHAIAVSWGSRNLFRLDSDGTVLARRPNPSKFIDHQDMQYLGDNKLLSTGIGAIVTPSGRLQIGGYALWDAATLELLVEVPVAAWMPSGRVATFNGAHTDIAAGKLQLHCLVDDTVAQIVTWQPAG